MIDRTTPSTYSGLPIDIISWNVNGLNSCIDDGGFLRISALNPDILCLQEVKTKEEPEVLPGYHHYYNHAERSGYSGTLVMSKEEPVSVVTGLGDWDKEGRVITAEFEAFFLINCYVPNSQMNLERYEYRIEWDRALLAYLEDLEREKPVILCGDFNTVVDKRDFFEENSAQFVPGYVDDERGNRATRL